MIFDQCLAVGLMTGGVSSIVNNFDHGAETTVDEGFRNPVAGLWSCL